MTPFGFISTTYRHHTKLILGTLILAMIVILLGAYTRLTNAGLSCPDWPNCYGFITAPHTPSQLRSAAEKFPLIPVDVKKAWTEMTHRYVAGTEGILILVFAFSLLLGSYAKHFKTILIALGLITLLVIQVLLGMLTVTEQLHPFIVVAHLLTGLSLLSLLWWAYLDLPLRQFPFFKYKNYQTHAMLIPLLWFALLIVFTQIALGGWVSSHHAGLVCVDFPYCNGQLFPALQWNAIDHHLITIHMLHRIGAAVTAIYLFIMSLFLLKYPLFRFQALFIIGIVATQLTLGILNIIWLRPIWIAMLHHAIAILLLLTIITLLVKLYVARNHHDAIMA